MKILLFDDILETHVRRSLARALTERGHTVFVSPKVWKGHYPPTEAEDINRIDSILDEALIDAPDVLFNFRASTLTPDMLARVRAAGVQSMVWLHDDPVLYRVCYRDIVEQYDIVLNCGGLQVLQFYKEKHGIRGVNFPFWTDKSEFPRVRFSTSASDYDIAFLGNLKGPVRQRRYDMIAALPGRLRIYGKADLDPRGLVKGYLNSEAEVAQALAPAQMALNIPQIFSDYRGHKYGFDMLARLGSFEYPSRVVQYAALGLPVFTLGLARPPAGFPEMLTAACVNSASTQLQDLLQEPQKLAALSDKTHARFETSFSADARAELLERLVQNTGPILAAGARFRAEVFAHPGQDPERSATAAHVPFSTARQALADAGADAKSKYRIIVCAPSDRLEKMSGHLRALRNLGHALTVRTWPTASEDILQAIKTFRAGVAIFVDVPTDIPTDLASGLQTAGCHILRIGQDGLKLPDGVDLTWMVEPTSENTTTQTTDILLAKGSREPELFKLLNERFALVDKLNAGSEAERLASLDQGLICVLPAGAYQNVLFEAVARGAVPAAPATQELLEVFTPDLEVIAFSDPEDLCQKIVQVLADPAELSRMRQRAFERLSGTHLLEQKWDELLDDLPAPVIERETRVMVTGYYGHENLGDELILDSLMEIAAEHRPEISFCVATAAAENLNHARGIEAVGLSDVPTLSRIAPTLDAAILGGGGLWHDYSFEAAGGVRALYDGAARSIGGYARPNLMAAACGVESHVYGMGVGPLSDPAAKVLIRHIAQQTNSITVRDTASLDTLQAIPGWSNQVTVAPDMVYALDLEARLADVRTIEAQNWTGGRPILLINLRDWALGDLEQLTGRIAIALTGMFRERPFAMLGLPMQEKNAMDAKVLDLLFSKIPGDVPRQILYWNGDSTKALEAISQADLVLSMRLHTCLLAHRLGKPTVGCSYDPKVAAHFSELGRSEFVFDFETQPGQLEDKLKLAAKETSGLPHEVRSRVKALEVASRQEMTNLILRLPSARPERRLLSGILRAMTLPKGLEKKTRLRKPRGIYERLRRLLKRSIEN